MSHALLYTYFAKHTHTHTHTHFLPLFLSLPLSLFLSLSLTLFLSLSLPPSLSLSLVPKSKASTQTRTHMAHTHKVNVTCVSQSMKRAMLARYMYTLYEIHCFLARSTLTSTHTCTCIKCSEHKNTVH